MMRTKLPVMRAVATSLPRYNAHMTSSMPRTCARFSSTDQKFKEILVLKDNLQYGLERAEGDFKQDVANLNTKANDIRDAAQFSAAFLGFMPLYASSFPAAHYLADTMDLGFTMSLATFCTYNLAGLSLVIIGSDRLAQNPLKRLGDEQRPLLHARAQTINTLLDKYIAAKKELGLTSTQQDESRRITKDSIDHIVTKALNS